MHIHEHTHIHILLIVDLTIQNILFHLVIGRIKGDSVCETTL